MMNKILISMRSKETFDFSLCKVVAGECGDVSFQSWHIQQHRGALSSGPVCTVIRSHSNESTEHYSAKHHFEKHWQGNPVILELQLG